MKHKTLITIIIASLLALLCALLLIKNVDLKTPIEDQEPQQEVTQESSVGEEENIFEDLFAIEKTPVFEKNDEQTNESIKAQNNAVETMTEEVVVQEGAVIEEVEDYGIRQNKDGLIEVTRDFKSKSPAKYYFKDFGILEKVSK